MEKLVNNEGLVSKSTKRHYESFIKSSKELLSGKPKHFDKFGRAIRYVEIPDRILKEHTEDIINPFNGKVVGKKTIIDKLKPIKLGYDRKNIKLRKQYARLRGECQVLC